MTSDRGRALKRRWTPGHRDVQSCLWPHLFADQGFLSCNGVPAEPKRAAASSLANAIGGTSNIWDSYPYYASLQYSAALGTLIGCGLLCAATITVYLMLVRRKNMRLDSKDPAKIAKAINGGVTEEMVALSWRYEMYRGDSPFHSVVAVPNAISRGLNPFNQDPGELSYKCILTLDKQAMSPVMAQALQRTGSSIHHRV